MGHYIEMLNDPALTFLTTTPVHQLLRAVEDFVVVLIASRLVVKELAWRSLLPPVFIAVIVGELIVFAVDMAKFPAGSSITLLPVVGGLFRDDRDQTAHILALIAGICVAGTLLTRLFSRRDVTDTRHVGAKIMVVAIILTPLAILIELGLLNLIKGEWRFGLVLLAVACVIVGIIAAPLYRLKRSKTRVALNNEN